MTSYLVRWDIDIEADTPQEAAKKALEIQRDPQSIATCFTVFEIVSGDVDGKAVECDVEEQP